MINVDKIYKVISIEDIEILSKEPIMMLMLIERAALTGYRLIGPTWDGICKNNKLFSNIPKDKVNLIFSNIFEHGDIEYAMELLFNGGIIQGMLGVKFLHVEDTILRSFDVDDIKTLNDFYYYLSLTSEENSIKLFGDNLDIVNYIKALNYLFDYCNENLGIRFNFQRTVELIDRVKKISPSVVESGLLYDDFKTTIKYLMK